MIDLLNLTDSSSIIMATIQLTMHQKMYIQKKIGFDIENFIKYHIDNCIINNTTKFNNNFKLDICVKYVGKLKIKLEPHQKKWFIKNNIILSLFVGEILDIQISEDTEYVPVNFDEEQEQEERKRQTETFK